MRKLIPFRDALTDQALLAGALFPKLGLGLTLGGGIVGAILAATIGAVILLLIVKVVRQLTA